MNTTKPQSSNSGNKTLILLIVLLVLSWIFLIYMYSNFSKQKSEMKASIDTLSSLKDQAVAQYNLALEQIKQLEAMNDSLKKKIGYDQNLIYSLKKKIESLLKNGTVDGKPSKQLQDAQALIQQLQAKIAEYLAEIQKLKAENEGLVKDKQVLSVENSDLKVRVDTLRQTNVVLKQKVDLASILVVGDVSLVGVQITGGEEKEIQKSNKMSILRAKFNVLENRVAESGMYDFYVTIQDPNGVILVDPSVGSSNKITLADGSEVQVSAKINTEVSQGQRKFVKFDYRSSTKFQPGTYTISVYQRGYKVGQGSGIFKKGFLFF